MSKLKWKTLAISGCAVCVALVFGIFGGTTINLDTLLGTDKPQPQVVMTQEAVEKEVNEWLGEDPAPPQNQLPVAETKPLTAKERADIAIEEGLQKLRVEEELAKARRNAERRKLGETAPLTPSVFSLRSFIVGTKEYAERNNTNTQPDPHDAINQVLAQTHARASGEQTQATPTPNHFPRLTPAPDGPFLARGTVLPATLLNMIDSDLPGLVRAMITNDVYDSLNGSVLLIPRGSFLVGTYGQSAETGQKRLFVSWTDLRLPNGSSIDLSGFGSIGADGASGVKGKRRSGFLSALGSAFAINLATGAAQGATARASGQNATSTTDLGELARAATGASIGNTTSSLLKDRFTQRTRFRVNGGTYVNVLVEQTFTLPPYTEP